MAYQFLQEAAKKRTESIVVEAAVDTTGSVKAELPVELVDLLLRNVYDGDEWESEGQVRTLVRDQHLDLNHFNRKCLDTSWAG